MRKKILNYSDFELECFVRERLGQKDVLNEKMEINKGCAPPTETPYSPVVKISDFPDLPDMYLPDLPTNERIKPENYANAVPQKRNEKTKMAD